MRRRITAITATVISAAALAAPLLTATPASAGNGTSSVGCSTGDSCTAQLMKMVTVTGDVRSDGGYNTVVDIAPPPCLWEPMGDTVQGSQKITAEYGTDPTKAPTIYQVNDAVALAEKYLTKPPAPDGTWYMLPINPAASAAGQAECAKLPLFAWEPPGLTPPGIKLPARTLAQIALARLQVPAPNGMTVNPDGRTTYINLPVYVKVALDDGNHPGPMPYATTTATLDDVVATVWVEPSKLQLGATGGKQYKLSTGGCGYLGSTDIDNAQMMASAGIGTPIDCGMVFQSPDTWQITARMTWRACWAPVAGGPPPANCQPVPGGGNLNPTVWPAHQVIANEIQSVDNGSGSGNG
ncbi:MAG TPA: hypothetical protein VH089_03880 [Streptosporangiaceae bacterium]|nr:hypothetical protein [Streptosporangiaceae bacterium]